VLDAAARERCRQLGRQVLVLMVRSLLPGAGVDALLAEAREAAREQGYLAAFSETGR